MASYAVTFNVPGWCEILVVWPVLVGRLVRYGYWFRRIRLTRGKFAIVDMDDYERLAKYRWHVKSKGSRGSGYYAARGYRKNGKVVVEWMHKVVMPVEEGMVVDHINRDSLDNRKANLRPATQRQNSWNSERGMNKGRSKYKGISWDGRNRKWQVVLCMDGRRMSFGCFADEVEAAREYDRVARKYKGEFAVLNFPNERGSRG